jgi:hypothetical protein
MLRRNARFQEEDDHRSHGSTKAIRPAKNAPQTRRRPGRR